MTDRSSDSGKKTGYIYLPKTLLQKLRNAFNKKFSGTQSTSVEALLEIWKAQQPILGSPPVAERIHSLLYTESLTRCEYQLVNGLCWILLGCPYRDYSYVVFFPEQRNQIKDKFDHEFKRGTRIAGYVN